MMYDINILYDNLTFNGKSSLVPTGVSYKVTLSNNINNIINNINNVIK